MSELTKSDLYEFLYLLLGQIAIMLMVITGDLFLIFFIVLFALMYLVHAWMGYNQMRTSFFWKRKIADVDMKIKQSQDKIELKKFEAIIDELKEIRKAIKKR